MDLRRSIMIWGVVIACGTAVNAQERPLAQKLLHVGEDTTAVITRDSTLVLSDTVYAVEPDTTAIDYVSPDAGAPGSDRGQETDRPRRKGGAMRIGIGIGVGLFSGLWISL